MFRITPEQQQMIFSAIRSGAFPTTAAASAGVPPATFARWLRRGRRRRRGACRAFWLQVRQAYGQARVLAEMEVRKKDVKFWLRYGPGKLAPAWGAPGKQRGKKSRRATDGQTALALASQLARAFPEESEPRRQLLHLIDQAQLRNRP